MKKSVKERIRGEVSLLRSEIINIDNDATINITEKLKRQSETFDEFMFVLTEILKDMECMEKAEIKKEHKTSLIVETTLNAYNQHIDEFWKEWEGK